MDRDAVRILFKPFSEQLLYCRTFFIWNNCHTEMFSEMNLGAVTIETAICII